MPNFRKWDRNELQKATGVTGIITLDPVSNIANRCYVTDCTCTAIEFWLLKRLSYMANFCQNMKQRFFALFYKFLLGILGS